MDTAFQPGLEDVVVAETALSLVDGARGRLVVRGHSIEDLGALRFEEMCALLWDGALPTPERREVLRGWRAGRGCGGGTWGWLQAAGDRPGAPRYAFASDNRVHVTDVTFVMHVT